ncbi:hypothetical protein GO986_18755 [Deinococcus sp. HMF7620]|uniref:Uncharacterized protein n=1 Tax=Deinococcus arboris TaxID=2682977 RepID=A0A7C9MB09_9DEIO|nr:hypothetical protein [Deinococcus arboris]MVN88783.1 hypothetical protein [Deinococcus arboris]
MDDPKPSEPYGSGPIPGTCGAQLRGKPGQYCKNPAGKGTTHLGEGKCRIHGGATPIKHGRYSSIQRPRLQELMAEFAKDADPLDTMPELLILRALVTDYIERYDALTDAITAWHLSHTSGYDEAVKLWREQLAAYLDEVNSGYHEPVMGPPRPPIPEAFENKPRQAPDILSVGKFIRDITGIVEQLQKRDSDQRITLVDLNRILEQLGVETVHAVKEVIPDDTDLSICTPAELRAQLVEVTERRWGTIRY